MKLLTEPGNAPLIAAAERAGFTQEGLLHGYLRERGHRVDVIMLSLLPDDVKEAGVKVWRAPLPPGVRPPFEVYVNGVRQELGRDYRVQNGELHFERELIRSKLGLRAWLLGFWGIGTYGRNDSIDVRYEVDGRPAVAQALPITPPD